MRVIRRVQPPDLLGDGARIQPQVAASDTLAKRPGARRAPASVSKLAVSDPTGGPAQRTQRRLHNVDAAVVHDRRIHDFGLRRPVDPTTAVASSGDSAGCKKDIVHCETTGPSRSTSPSNRPGAYRGGMAGRCHVVVLNWNGRDSIRPCLESVLHQTYGSYRVVVVDNASTDGSRDVVRDEFPEVTLVPLPENLHFARGTNAGLREAFRDPECAFIATLNNDTRVDPEWLAELVRMAGPRVGMVASKMVFFDRPNVLNSTGVCIGPDGSAMDRGWNSVDEGQFDQALDVFGPSAGAALYRRDVLGSVGLFGEGFLAYYEDLDLALRACRAGWEARVAPRAVVHHKKSAPFRAGNPMKKYLCQPNLVWNLVQNYPWRYVTTGIPWNLVRVMAGPLPRDGSPGTPGRPPPRPIGQTAAAMAPGRPPAVPPAPPPPPEPPRRGRTRRAGCP